MNRYLSLIVAVLLSIATTAYATSVRRLNLDDLITTAHSIVEGDVVGSRTYRSDDGKLILTSYTINVRESLKGAPGSTVTLTTVGGRIGNSILHVAGMPVFQPGEKAVLFLEKSRGYTTVVGLNQGKFTISNNEVSNSLTGLSFPDRAPAKIVKMPLDEFKRQIQLRLNR
jgi:hypothetical protein